MPASRFPQLPRKHGEVLVTRSGTVPISASQLQESQLRLQTILKLSPVGVGVTRLRDGVIIEFNDALLEILGYSREEVVGRSSAELKSWANPEERSAVFSRLSAGEPVRDMISTIRRKDGVIRQGRFSAAVVELAGEPHIIGNLRDVTDEVAAEHERQLSQRRLSVALSMMPITVFHQNLDLRYTFIVSPQIGQPADTIIGHFDHELFEAPDAATLTTIKRRVLLSGKGERHEIAIHLNGQSLWFDTLIEPEYNANGEVTGIICAGANITERKQREDRYRAVLEDQTELIGRYRPDGTMVYANEVYCRFFGKTEAEIVGHKWHPAAHPDDVPMIEAKLASLSPDTPLVTIENRVTGADGQEHWMQFANRALFDNHGQLHEIQSVGREISARKKAEQALAASRAELHALFEATDHQRETQRKEIAQDIHDQLGATLTAISFRLNALRHLTEDNTPAIEEIANIKNLLFAATQASRDICNRLRPPSLDDLGLIPTCRWYLQDWAKLVGIKASSRFAQSGEELPEPWNTDIYRVFQELLTNVAKHAGASSVRVSLSNGRQSFNLHVTDDGRGFAAGKSGPGFGLAGIRERMARYGGTLHIESGSEGSTVSIRIPRTANS